MNTLNKTTLNMYRGIRRRPLSPEQIEKLEQERLAYRARQIAECICDSMIASFFSTGAASLKLLRDLPRHGMEEHRQH